MSNIELYNGDCLEVMKQIPDKSIDMICCDLPYGTTACSWDSVIPFDKLWNEYKRIRKDTTPIILFSSQPFTTMLINSNIKEFKEELIWLKNKSSNGIHLEKRHNKVHENIIVFSKGIYTYNPIKWNVSEKKFLTQRKTFSFYGESNEVYGSFKRQRKPDDGSRYPISILSYAVPISMAKSKTYSDDIDIRLHPTQKPLDLIEYLIKTYSNEGDIVLDNCMGSGTTGVACKKLNRDFIGIELDENYFNLAKERIENNIDKIIK